MSRQLSVPSVYCDQPLPECQGPRLGPFEYRNAPIKFISRLDESNDEGSESNDGAAGAHGYVFKVSINSKLYALKVFKFYDPLNERSMLTKSENHLVSDDTIICHTDPFYAECRAYGRIEEDKRKKKRKGDIVVPCYGFLGIAAEQEKMLRERFGARLWDGAEDEKFRKRVQGQPMRALVKELVEEQTSFTEQTLKRMLRDLRALRRIGIYPRDICARNYRGGRLVDFGASCTEPYVLFQICPEWQVEFWKSDDLAMFDEMIEDQSIETEVRATPNHEYCKRLRLRKGADEE